MILIFEGPDLSGKSTLAEQVSKKIPNTYMMKMCHRLEEEGIYVNPILPPAVPVHQCLVRISLMATHTRDQVSFALEVLQRVGKELGII